MKLIISISRFVVGVLFIFSGLIKANDPLGLSYKMQEFFEVWNFHWLDNYTLTFSVIMIVFEIVAGVAILLGWKMKLFSWLLLLLIIFFTFLTGYAFLSGKVRECGCFGDCIPLTAGASFSKDILLLIMILFLFVNRNKIKPILTKVPSIAVLLVATVASFSFQWFVLQHLPVIDCLAYKVGVNIPDQMKPPPGAVPDSTVISFVYKQNGQQIEFTADKFPKDFDSNYKFIKRYDKLIRKGNAEPSIKDFTLITLSGNDSTQALLQQKGYKIFLFVKEMTETNPTWNKELNVILTFAKSKH
ncbi:MAG TPA: BT_3928 family protein, partial [Puia sp.]|nr:BT_3928 family protein [Puia sp.]